MVQVSLDNTSIKLNEAINAEDFVKRREKGKSISLDESAGRKF